MCQRERILTEIERSLLEEMSSEECAEQMKYFVKLTMNDLYLEWLDITLK